MPECPNGSEWGLRELACRWTWAMFKLMKVPVLAVALAASLWLPHGSQHIGSLSPATTCKLPRDLTSLVWHRELAERGEAVNFLHNAPQVAYSLWVAFQLCLLHIILLLLLLLLIIIIIIIIWKNNNHTEHNVMYLLMRQHKIVLHNKENGTIDNMYYLSTTHV